MDKDHLKKMLTQVSRGDLAPDQAVEKLRHLPFEDIGMARIDHHRQIRRGQPEVIFAPGKTTGQIIKIAGKIRRTNTDVIISRMDKKQFPSLKKKMPKAHYFADARLALILAGNKKQPKELTSTRVLVCTGGTADIPVAEEAALTAWIMGCPVDRLYDVGVAGIHRLFDGEDLIKSAGVIIAVAGMEGALASVVAGLVDVPVIAVPTSIGYGASFGGMAALLAMLNSCASGVTVVNIDNGFGAGVAAATTARLISKGEQ